MRALFLLLISLSSLVGYGQILSYKLETDFGVTWQNNTDQISTRYSLNEAKREFRAWYDRYNAEFQVDPVNYPNRNDENFMKQSILTAAWNEAIWRNHANIHIGTRQDGSKFLITCQSRSNIEVGAGDYVADIPLAIAHGQYTGHGSSAFYTNGSQTNNGTVPQGSTQIRLDKEGWLGNPKQKFIFRSSTWGREDLQSYQESFSLTKFRLKGQEAQASFTGDDMEAGVAVWDMGSVSSISYIFAENFGTAGIYHVRGTPGTVNTITSFRNGLAGVLIEGGGTFSYSGSNEFDENPAMFHTRAGYGRPGWCSLTTSGQIKGETGIAPARPISVWQRLLVSEDGGNFNFETVNYAAVNGFPHTLIYINPRVNSSFINIDMLHLFGPCYALIHDAANLELWLTDAPGGLNKNGYWTTRHKNLVWQSQDGGVMKSSFLETQPVPVGREPLFGLPANNDTGSPIGTWDNVNSLPRYTYLGQTTQPPPPVPCTWNCTEWDSTCVDGILTRTRTCTSQGNCTNTPSPITREIRSCPKPTVPDPIRTTQIAVVINSDDPLSEEIGTYYASQRKGSRIVRVRLGNSDQQTNLTTVNTARTAINALPDSIKVLALCFTKPTRVGAAGNMASASTKHASINYALTHSFTTTSNMLSTWSASARIAGLVQSRAQVDSATVAHRNGKKGTNYAVSCWDAPSSGNPRGGAVAAHTKNIRDGVTKIPVPLNWTDARPLANTNWGANFIQNTPDMIGYWTGIGNPVTGITTNKILRGAIADNVTSYGGRIGEHGGQESILTFTNAGFLMVTGTVVEPYQSATGNSPGSLVEQFMNSSVALPLWLGGKSAAEVYRASVRCPVRNLGVFDPWVAPYLGVDLSSGGTTPPPPTSADGLIWRLDVSGSTGSVLKANVGSDASQTLSWANWSVSNGVVNTQICSQASASISNVKRIVLLGVTINAVSDWGWFNSAVRTRSNNTLQDSNGNTLATFSIGQKSSRMELVFSNPVTLQSILGHNDPNTCGAVRMSFEGMEIYNK